MTIRKITHWVFFLLAIQLVYPGFHERRLLVDLMSDYNKLERPVYNETDPVILTFGLTLQQIIDVVSYIFHLNFHCVKIMARISWWFYLELPRVKLIYMYVCIIFDFMYILGEAKCPQNEYRNISFPLKVLYKSKVITWCENI